MDGETSQNEGNLEDQLRQLILSNVTIAQGEPDQRAPPFASQQLSRGRGRGRGRARSDPSRGRGGRNNRASVDPSLLNNTPPDNSLATRGVPSPWRGNSSRRTHSQANPHSPTTARPYDDQTPQERARPLRAAKGATSQMNEAFTTHLPHSGQTPQILQPPQASGSSDASFTPPHFSRAPRQARQFGPHSQQFINQLPENPIIQINYLDRLASQEVPKVEMTLQELKEKEAFRMNLESICREAIAKQYQGNIATINLVGFGSLASGFATPGSDMDLAIVPVWKDSSKAQGIGVDREIPRLLESAVLAANMGGRLLTRTRVPILKVCQIPTEELYKNLLEEREKWDALSYEEKYPRTAPAEPSSQTPADQSVQKSTQLVHDPDNFPTLQEAKANKNIPIQSPKKGPDPVEAKILESPVVSTKNSVAEGNNAKSEAITAKEPKQQQPRNERPWLREKTLGPLDFPKTGVGIQCDINFENPLGIHNTHLLRCYALSDPRVRPMVLFVKAWAKRRKINSSYSGTLSSYGWVLMVLHYLVNVASPPVCVNLQTCWRPPIDLDVNGLEQLFKNTEIGGYAVRFWRNEDEITHAARSGQLTSNDQSVGALLRGFFQYYASLQPPYMYGPKPPTFYWTAEVLSLRTPGGIRTKSEKGWTGAKTTISNGKEVRHRYLFCIEDPFELDHNVARTVTHNGIVAIRDEFRRAWGILSAIGRGQEPNGNVFDEVIEQTPPPTPKKVDSEQKSTSEDAVNSVPGQGAQPQQTNENNGNTVSVPEAK